MPRLRRSNSSGPGIRRIRAGKGFSYRDADGRTVDAETRERIEALAIPPAWTDVWIAPFQNGHIQAMGTDSAGRRQYLYHPEWRVRQDRLKFDRALALAESLPGARRMVTMDLRGDGLTRRRALAAGFRMLDTGFLRVGSERYALQHGSHGLSTLLCAHADVRKDTITLEFPGKSGQEWSLSLRDPDLAPLVRNLKRREPNARLLAYKEEGEWHPVAAEDINDYVRERTGGDFTAKDFRTLHGTVAAAVELAKAGPQRSPTARKRVVNAAVKEVAAQLGNTPSVARTSYIDPRVIDHFDHGRTIDPNRLHAAESELRALLFD